MTLLRPFGRLARRFHADESATTAIEYALIASGIGATIAATVYNMGSTLKTVWWDKIAGVL
jgi:Flp pilus assembly pilin Flp